MHVLGAGNHLACNKSEHSASLGIIAYTLYVEQMTFQIVSEVILYVKQLAEMYDSFHDSCRDYLYTVYYTFIYYNFVWIYH